MIWIKFDFTSTIIPWIMKSMHLLILSKFSQLIGDLTLCADTWRYNFMQVVIIAAFHHVKKRVILTAIVSFMYWMILSHNALSGSPNHSAANRINAEVHYRFLLPRFLIIMLYKLGTDDVIC